MTLLVATTLAVLVIAAAHALAADPAAAQVVARGADVQEGEGIQIGGYGTHPWTAIALAALGAIVLGLILASWLYASRHAREERRLAEDRRQRGLE
jgi:hypothetical protein